MEEGEGLLVGEDVRVGGGRPEERPAECGGTAEQALAFLGSGSSHRRGEELEAHAEGERLLELGRAGAEHGHPAPFARGARLGQERRLPEARSPLNQHAATGARSGPGERRVQRGQLGGALE